jgi:hypothetical protein
MKKLLSLIAVVGMLSFAHATYYNVGQTVTSSDQNIAFDVCYGDYSSSTLSLADFNGDLNGGNYKVIHIDMSASW